MAAILPARLAQAKTAAARMTSGSDTAAGV
jgi:hypothetical protein